MSSERKIYHVEPNEGKWNVKGEHAQRASSRHETKSEAVERARELAKNQELGQVIIHKRDGTIETEYTYGADPRNIPG